MKPHAETRANEAVPLLGLGIVQGERAPSQRAMRAALADMPHVVEAISPAPVPVNEDTYDNTPGFANPEGPAAPRM